ncbi:hypothetical protein [Methylobacterium sp. WL19]|uniref:hypothetical protein n=1 Tax=Methylobacterium sp. WL19 TaxID=2603896 RepID=UPI0011C8D585|nr:hypothetical protein [Methylobacterium sp. WL19]TXN33877.1 hypothetical protein FV220_00040 [Methylobacterium sp. WL19]
MAERYAIIDQTKNPKLVVDVFAVEEGEELCVPSELEDRAVIAVPDGEPVAEGWKWTKRDGFRAA